MLIRFVKMQTIKMVVVEVTRFIVKEINSLEKMIEEREVRIEEMIENMSVLIYLIDTKRNCFRFYRR